MRRHFIRTFLFLLFLLTIPFSLLKNQAAAPSVRPDPGSRDSRRLPYAQERAIQERTITITVRSTAKPLRLSADDSLRVDHIIELY